MSQILLQEDLEIEKLKLEKKHLPLKIKIDKLQLRIDNLKSKLREAEKKEYEISQKIASKNGLISCCTNGKVKVATKEDFE